MLTCIGVYVFLAAVPTFFWCQCDALALVAVPVATLFTAIPVAVVLAPVFNAGHIEPMSKRLLVFVIVAGTIQASCGFMSGRPRFDL